MSYLCRLAARTANTRAKAPAIVPKGLGNRQAPAISRTQDSGEEEETLAPMCSPVARRVRRKQEEGESDEVPAATRDEEEPAAQRQSDNNEVAPLRRQEEEQEELATLRRQADEEGDEETVQTVRRQEEGDEEVAQPVRRQGEEEEAMPMREIARQEEVPLEETSRPAPPPGQADLEPDAGPVSQELAVEQEPSELQALRREVSPGADLSPPASPLGAQSSGSLADAPTPFQPREPDFAPGLGTFEMALSNSPMKETHPTVVIDQLDVLIHEQVAPAERTAPRQDRNRAMRARYLRRL